MRRALVLTDESARHPFRASLPLHWRRTDEAENRRSWRLNFGLSGSDARAIARTYCAAFLATTVYFF